MIYLNATSNWLRKLYIYLKFTTQYNLSSMKVSHKIHYFLDIVSVNCLIFWYYDLQFMYRSHSNLIICCQLKLNNFFLLWFACSGTFFLSSTCSNASSINFLMTSIINISTSYVIANIQKLTHFQVNVTFHMICTHEDEKFFIL